MSKKKKAPRFDNVKDDPRFAATEYVVEATSEEQLFFWSRNDKAEAKYKVNWQEIPLGIGICVGEIDKRPIYVCFTWARLNGHLVCFWEPTSEVVDYKQIHKWLKKFMNPKDKRDGRDASCNNLNFAHCLEFVSR